MSKIVVLQDKVKRQLQLGNDFYCVPTTWDNNLQKFVQIPTNKWRKVLVFTVIEFFVMATRVLSIVINSIPASENLIGISTTTLDWLSSSSRSIAGFRASAIYELYIFKDR